MIDVDDVLTNFNRAFLKLCHETFGTPNDVQIREWDFYKSVPGLTFEMEQLVWEKIEQTVNFYETLPAYGSKEDFLSLRKAILEGKHEFYFITSRFPTKGKSVEEQTCSWIEQHVGVRPVVLVTPRKGRLCKELGIEIALDDAPHHIEDLASHGIRTVVMDWSYNRHIKDLPRVKSLGEFIELLDGVKR
ncbi:5' nucleotidase, NT5C type [Pseudothermotoga sp. U03pept]|uniref:5' nucleotidase, NT5C type n=1 Tax=Pseudothermotoga sp. U03pept TaxID=3447012 RepID=UPI003F0260DE